MIGRPSLLLLTAVSAAVATIGNAVGLAASPREPQARSRLGVAIADDVSARNRAATQRGRTLDLREQAVRAAERRLKTGVEQRQQPANAAEPGQPAAPGAAPASDQYDDLARIYQAMKPAAAALVLERLDIDVQMRVAQKMRERSTAMLLAAMTPKGAAALTMALAQRNVPRAAAVEKLR
ncbi:hypothetical protein [Sphingomonas sp.]|jgi:flagellar motility protein MotE (MotC chaperone)|uniref:MotE family protein n=1 Tax=Sphingomonas sp. TaxID=28214 RepID=UPI002EDA15B3